MATRSELEQDRAQAQVFALLVIAIARLWRGMEGQRWETAWRTVGPQLVTLVSEAQQTAAAASQTYILAAAAEQGITTATPAFDPASVAGVAGDGRDLEGLLYGGVVEMAKAYAANLRDLTDQLAVEEARISGQHWVEQAAQTAVADASRAAQKVAITEQPRIAGYVRMIEPGACSRCVVLAGRFYRWNEGFDRHPNCRCEHVPATEDNIRFQNSRTNPNLYFDRLSRAEQDRVFTEAGAEAIRLGADISQVVNARRGMQKAQLYGRDVRITTEGTTRRGGFGYLEAKRGGELVSRNVGRRGAVKNYVERRAKRARLMPETILAEARDRDDAVRLLRLYGFLT